MIPDIDITPPFTAETICNQKNEGLWPNIAGRVMRTEGPYRGLTGMLEPSSWRLGSLGTDRPGSGVEYASRTGA